MVSMNDHRTPEGDVDWKSYKQAQIENGEICSKCFEYILFSSNYRTTCNKCKQLLEPPEITHHKFIRCPNCLNAFDPYETEWYEVLSDGEHEVSCSECNHDFEISTYVDYSFRSPKEIEQKE